MNPGPLSTPDALGREWPADLRAKMRALSYALAEAHAEIPGDPAPDAVFATWFGDSLLVLGRGTSARQIAAFIEASGIADPEIAPESGTRMEVFRVQ